MERAKLLYSGTGLISDVGCRRSINEDRALARPEVGVWVVADGMGGHAAGDFASQAIVDEIALVAPAPSLDILEAGVRLALTTANRKIQDRSEQLGMSTIGSTVAALLVLEDEYVCLWSGDSRVYVQREEGCLIMQLTRDHTEVQGLVDAGAITTDQARKWPGKNVITRAIGVFPDIELERTWGHVFRGDLFILCSDGLTEHLTDDEIKTFALEADPQRACEEMVAETLARGGKDNVTVLCAAFRGA